MYQVVVDLQNKEQTGKDMHAIVRDYHKDLEHINAAWGQREISLSQAPLFVFFDFVRRIPFRRDTVPVEVNARPFYIVKYQELGMDCKKKSILMASWLRCRNMTYRFLAVSTSPDKHFHHVFTQLSMFGHWRNLDPTYRDNTPFEVKQVTNYAIL